MSVRDQLAEIDDELLFLDPPETFDACVLGVGYRCGQDPVVVYDEDKVIEALGLPEDEAREYFEFNVAGAYVGPRTPIFLIKC